jgi:hypothetical protein
MEEKFDVGAKWQIYLPEKNVKDKDLHWSCLMCGKYCIEIVK